MKNPIAIILTTFLGFFGFYVFRKTALSPVYEYFKLVLDSEAWSYLFAYWIMGIPIFIAVFILHKGRNFWHSLGMDKGFLKGLGLGLIWTLPMLIGYALVFTWNTELTFKGIMTGAICAALYEELYYRGFLFGQIYRNTRFGFFPSIILGAFIFALGHLYQSHDPTILVGVFITTFLGAGLFAWVYVEWNFNLWTSIFLHFFMNLFWMFFSAGETALGDVYANIFRVMTITFVIISTIIYKKRSGQGLAVFRDTLWMKKEGSLAQ